MTVKDKYIHKFYAFAMAAVFALVLAGCGGGGGDGSTETPMTGPTDAERIASAQMAATTAAGVAAAALAAVEANQSADLDSYIRASIANDNAQTALEAANAATTPAAAEAAQADAEAASADVQKYAGMVTNAHNAIEAARMELMALNDARAAAMKAYMDAKAALDAIAGQGDADSDSYDMAVAALAAALMANDAAQAAETSADAEAAQANAEAALADVQKYAGMVTTAHMEATALSTAQQAAMQAYMDAKAALMAAEADKDEDIASYTRAEDAVADAKAASDEAAAATTSADAQAAQADAEAARDAANGFIAMIATAKSDREEMERMAAAKAAANKVALTKKAAITSEGDATNTANDVRPFDGANAYDTTDGADNTATNYRIQIKHDGGPKVTVTDGALPADNDPMYAQVATFGNGQMLVRNIGTDRKIIVLHTDIEAPDQVAFSSEYTLTVDRDTDTTANDTYAVLATDNGKIASSSFPSGASTSRTYVEYDADTATGRASQFSGTFDGASGMFRCVASGGCTVSTDAMGKFNALTAAQWEFTPNAGATVAKPDGDYLTYGFWLDTKTKDGNVTQYETVQTFASSSLDPSTGLSTVTGTATYDGHAAGVYVHESKKEDGTLDTAMSGRFTADVSLKAYFDATTTRTADTIEGTISNFDLDGGPDNTWNVNLSAASIDTDTGFTGNASGMTGDNGSLSGRFHGTGDADDNTVAPPVLVGEFNANFVNGTAAGAFGARKQ